MEKSNVRNMYKKGVLALTLGLAALVSGCASQPVNYGNLTSQEARIYHACLEDPRKLENYNLDKRSYDRVLSCIRGNIETGGISSHIQPKSLEELEQYKPYLPEKTYNALKKEKAEEKKTDTEKREYASSHDADTFTALNIDLNGLDKEVIKEHPILGRLIIFLLKTGIVDP